MGLPHPVYYSKCQSSSLAHLIKQEGVDEGGQGLFGVVGMIGGANAGRSGEGCPGSMAPGTKRRSPWCRRAGNCFFKENMVDENVGSIEEGMWGGMRMSLANPPTPPLL